MSTISKINIGGKDYDIGSSGLGTKLGSSDDLNNFTMLDTRYYYDGNGTAPAHSPITRLHTLVGYNVSDGSAVTNDPDTSSYRLDVMGNPNSSGDVVQVVSASGGVHMEREHTSSGWGEWKRVNEFDGGLVSVYKPSNTSIKYAVSNNVVTIFIDGPVVPRAGVFATIPAEFAPICDVYTNCASLEPGQSIADGYDFVGVIIRSGGELYAQVSNAEHELHGAATYCISPMKNSSNS